MTKMLKNKDDKLVWVPEGGIANVAAPTVAELTAASVKDFSCVTSASNFSLGATGNETIQDPPLCAAGNDSVPGAANYEASMEFYRDSTTGADIGYTTFTDRGIGGFWVHRIGKPYTDAFATADKVRVFQVICGTPQVINPDSGALRKLRVQFYPQSAGVNERAVVA